MLGAPRRAHHGGAAVTGRARWERAAERLGAMIPSEEVSARRREIEDKLKQVGLDLGRSAGAAGAWGWARARSPPALPGRRGWVWSFSLGRARPGTPRGSRHPPPGLGAPPGPPSRPGLQGRGISAPGFGPGFPLSVRGRIRGLSRQVQCVRAALTGCGSPSACGLWGLKASPCGLLFPPSVGFNDLKPAIGGCFASDT